MQHRTIRDVHTDDLWVIHVQGRTRRSSIQVRPASDLHGRSIGHTVQLTWLSPVLTVEAAANEAARVVDDLERRTIAGVE